jgi:hypothetical protein
VHLYECDCLPRAYIARSFRVEADPTKTYELLKSPDFDPSAEVVLAEQPPTAAQHGATGFDVVDAKVVADEGTGVAIHASVPEGGGFLVLSDSFDEGWFATVDKSQAEVLRANGMFRAIRLGTGSHRVVLEYWPLAMMRGCLVTLAASTGLAAALAAVELRRRRRR